MNCGKAVGFRSSRSEYSNNNNGFCSSRYYLDMVEVAGSSPVVPTNLIQEQSIYYNPLSTSRRTALITIHIALRRLSAIKTVGKLWDFKNETQKEEK